MPQKILVVDDEPEIVNLLQRRLESNGYDVITALEGTSALQKAKQEIPDLIILDVMLPDIRGTEVMKQLKEDDSTQGIPVLFLTALDSPSDVIKHFDLGAENHLTKPIDAEELLAHVKDILESL